LAVAKHTNLNVPRHSSCYVVQSYCEQTDGSPLIKLSEDPARYARCGACGETSTLVHVEASEVCASVTSQ